MCCKKINDQEDNLKMLIERKSNAHKGDHGSLGILGGAQGMVGAAFLAARTAVFSGCGRVYVVRPNLADGFVLDTHAPEVMVIDFHESDTKPINAWVAGPGLGTSSAAHDMLAQVMHTPHPLLIDADALNLMAEDPALGRQCKRRTGPTIITPHPGEAARLVSSLVSSLVGSAAESTVQAVQSNRNACAQQLADQFNAIVVLKGAGTVITAPSQSPMTNTTGNAALATAGTGDVLSGLIGALLAQGLAPLDAATAGVRLHGLAAEALTAQVGGMLGISASELIPEIRRLINA
jgi:ADP-dependent NAD(P)H-hydrate dehydratase / NAD(P)H-hydrate epimerase